MILATPGELDRDRLLKADFERYKQNIHTRRGEYLFDTRNVRFRKNKNPYKWKAET